MGIGDAGNFLMLARILLAQLKGFVDVGALDLDVDGAERPKFSTWLTMSAVWK